MRKLMAVIFLACSASVVPGVVAGEPNQPAEKLLLPKAPMIDPNLPTVFLVGDSTVKQGRPGHGWGYFVGDYFDPNRINVQNRAIGGRSARSFMEEGRWQRVLDDMKPGDSVLLQLGHNDGSLNKPERFSLKGLGEETQDANHPKTGEPIKIHTYGWYLRKYVADTRAKGGTLIFVTPVLRNSWRPDGTNDNSMGQYAQWMREVAAQEKVLLLDLNSILMKRYNELGKDKVSSEFFTEGDKTHTNPAGSQYSAASLAAGLKELKGCGLSKYVTK